MKKVLTIAGSDCSGGAGIQADLKTFSAHGVYGMSVITAVTAQNTQGVYAVQDISRDVVAQQIEAIFDDIEVDGVKVGMVSQVQTIEVIAERLRHYALQTIVVDPVMISKSGYHLLNPEAEVTLIKELLPLAMLVTPNIPEAEAITKTSISSLQQMEEASKKIYQMGAKNVLLKGGHLEGDAIDILYDGQEFSYFHSSRIATKNTHGTGCTLSSAITANLAVGYSLNKAISLAKEYITIAIQHSLSIGKGVGPTHHFYTLYKKAGIIE
ncbi:bifunctional hydroxy-methylpyrimidine kinase and hydroxy-phosphomethylpyrimidine kinase [Candidatus Desulfosporosinus infrequens]|uniref:Hydroxymethylpyrimidine/phosphomethylpyrimidine kinase n=1 Tax=Candidatus Desulfosporosinus infrequens TaxID=2043169 RepID=A0A2U3K177_9FIRM|nr:bifunctional hydroxy-methylpyrimidine kinase and hydroxy-phosphomethylpyrimidine kinase [Candidatus Desulfosporosinus infrequens]